MSLQARLAGDAELERARAEAAARHEEERAAEAAVAAVDAEAGALRGRARAVERQLYGGTVRNPQDLLTMQHELEAMRARLGETEDAELQRMEESEAAASARAAADAAVAAIEERRAGEAGPLTERLEAVRGDLGDAEAELADVRTRVPAGELSLFQRVAAHRQPAVVRVESGSCGGCHLPLSINEVRSARVGAELVQCSNCDRILVP